MSFHFIWSTEFLNYKYTIGDEELSKVFLFCALSVLIDCKFSFTDHIIYTVNKATRVLGFITRYSKHFKNIKTLKCLYFLLVRPIIDPILWRLCQDDILVSIERVQNRFLRFVARQTDLPFDYNNYNCTVLKYELKITLISQWFLFSDLLLLFKIINGRINCSNLLFLFDFYMCHKGHLKTHYYHFHQRIAWLNFRRK